MEFEIDMLRKTWVCITRCFLYFKEMCSCEKTYPKYIYNEARRKQKDEKLSWLSKLWKLFLFERVTI